jgi:hypothetical protein
MHLFFLMTVVISLDFPMRSKLLFGVASYEMESEIDVGHSTVTDQEFVTGQGINAVTNCNKRTCEGVLKFAFLICDSICGHMLKKMKLLEAKGEAGAG